VFKSKAAILIAIMLISFSAIAKADGVDDDVLQKLLGASGKNVAIKPIKADDALRLTSNKDQIIRLDQDAASVIVNNPAHATVLLDSPRLLIIMPRTPGATSFKVLDDKGEIILQKDIIVTNAQPKYVRIRRMCNGGACVPEAYFYCPDGCYEVTPVPGGSGIIAVPPPPSGGHRSSDNGDILNGGGDQPKPPENPVHATEVPLTPLNQ
jgi:hypothetical protein